MEFDRRSQRQLESRQSPPVRTGLRGDRSVEPSDFGTWGSFGVPSLDGVTPKPSSALSSSGRRPINTSSSTRPSSSQHIWDMDYGGTLQRMPSRGAAPPVREGLRASRAAGAGGFIHGSHYLESNDLADSDDINKPKTSNSGSSRISKNTSPYMTQGITPKVRGSHGRTSQQQLVQLHASAESLDKYASIAAAYGVPANGKMGNQVEPRVSSRESRQGRVEKTSIGSIMRSRTAVGGTSIDKTLTAGLGATKAGRARPITEGGGGYLEAAFVDSENLPSKPAPVIYDEDAQVETYQALAYSKYEQIKRAEARLEAAGAAGATSSTSGSSASAPAIDASLGAPAAVAKGRIEVSQTIASDTDDSPKLHRPQSRKLYLGSNHAGGGDVTTKLERPTSRKLYLGSSSSSTSKKTRSDHKARPSRSADYNKNTAGSASGEEPAKGPPGRTVLKRLSSFSGFNSSSLEAEDDINEKRPPSRQSSAIPLHLDGKEETENGRRSHDDDYAGDDAGDDLRGVGLWTEIVSNANGESSKPTRLAGEPIDLDQLSSDDEIFTKHSQKSNSVNRNQSQKQKQDSLEDSEEYPSPGHDKSGKPWQKVSSEDVTSIFRVMNSDNNLANIATMPEATGPWNRADLPTRGLSDPVSDGFTMLGDDSWPFPIQVNYSTRSSRSKFAPSVDKDGEPTSPSCSSATQSLGTGDFCSSQAPDDDDDDDDDDADTGYSLNSSEESLSKLLAAESTATELSNQHHSQREYNPEKDNMRPEVSPPETARSLMPRSPITKKRQAHTNINTIYNSQSIVSKARDNTSVAPSTPKASKRIAAHRPSMRRESEKYETPNENENETVGLNPHTSLSTAAPASAVAAVAAVPPATGPSGDFKTIGSDRDKNATVLSIATKKANHIPVSTTSNNITEPRSLSTSVSDAGYEGMKKRDKGGVQQQQEGRPNGIFNVDEELLDSSLGEDFLSLFAAPKAPKRKSSGPVGRS